MKVDHKQHTLKSSKRTDVVCSNKKRANFQLTNFIDLKAGSIPGKFSSFIAHQNISLKAGFASYLFCMV